MPSFFLPNEPSSRLLRESCPPPKSSNWSSSCGMPRICQICLPGYSGASLRSTLSLTLRAITPQHPPKTMCGSGRPSALWLLVLHFLCVMGVVNAALVNRTIDDVRGDSATGEDVQFAPSTVWFNQTKCETCNNVPDAARTFDNTWTAALYIESVGSMSVAFTFSGTAIYIFFVIPNFPSNSNLAQDVRCDFSIDGKVVGSFGHTSDGSGNFQYDTLVFSKTNLAEGDHTFAITTSGSTPAIVIFDRAIYSFVEQDDKPPAAPNTPSPPTSSSGPTTAPFPSSPDTTPITSSSLPSISPSSARILFPTGSGSITGAPVTLPPFYTADPNATPAIPAIPGSKADTDTSSSPTANRLITTIASAAGGAILIVFLGLVVYLRHRRRAQQRALAMSAGTVSSFDLLHHAKDSETPQPHYRLAAQYHLYDEPNEPRRRLPPPPSTGYYSPSASSVAVAGPSTNDSDVGPGYSAAAAAGYGYGRVVGATQTKPGTGTVTPTSTAYASVGHVPPTSFRAGRYGHGHAHRRTVSSVSLSESETGSTTTATRSQSHAHAHNVNDSLRINIPQSAFALATAASPSPSASGTHSHSPVTRHGAPLPPEQDAAVRQLLYNALANQAGAGGSFDGRSLSTSVRVSGGSAGYYLGSGACTPTPTSGTMTPMSRYHRDAASDIWDADRVVSPGPMQVVHVDSGIRIRQTLMDQELAPPPGYSLS
ncbi:hypothetical protein MKEN_00387600 [Mycena kentingensis (nom. inval.)]|nr:hypothetical protein MKEN_00387600 [Mycena kentingensis (nom. inval.)]